MPGGDRVGRGGTAREDDLTSIGAIVELCRALPAPEPLMLVTDSLETLREFAERLRDEVTVQHGTAAATGIEVSVTRRDKLPDLVQLGPLEVIVDPRAPAKQVFRLRLPAPPDHLPLPR